MKTDYENHKQTCSPPRSFARWLSPQPSLAPRTRFLLGTTARPNNPSSISSTKVTKPGSPDFVPVPERIAVFDNDGTLWCEQPVPVQFYFVADRVKALAPQHPEWKTKEPFASLLRGDVKAALERRRPRAHGTLHGHAHRHDHRRVCAAGQGLDRHRETSGDRQALHST